ncbi:MAG: alpha/beta fold hydrolase [Thermoleophilaceae bacterium]
MTFGPVKQITAGVLDVGHADVGPADGPAVVLLHGWPYDLHTFAEVSSLLAAASYRVIVPYLRGYGTTRFLSDDTLRNAQQSVLAVDAVALMDALGIEKAVVGGADWGARTADIVAALWPERCAGLVSVSGYLIAGQQAGERPVGAGGRAAVVVPVLLRDRARPGRVRAPPARIREAHLADGIAAVALRRRHVRAQRRLARQPRIARSSLVIAWIHCTGRDAPGAKACVDAADHPTKPRRLALAA